MSSSACHGFALQELYLKWFPFPNNHLRLTPTVSKTQLFIFLVLHDTLRTCLKLFITNVLILLSFVFDIQLLHRTLPLAIPELLEGKSLLYLERHDLLMCSWAMWWYADLWQVLNKSPLCSPRHLLPVSHGTEIRQLAPVQGSSGWCCR